jgi:hypothetical protein
MLVDDLAEAGGEPADRVVPARLAEAQVSPLAQQRRRGAIRGVDGGGQLERLAAGPAAVDGVDPIARDLAQPPVARPRDQATADAAIGTEGADLVGDRSIVNARGFPPTSKMFRPGDPSVNS